MFRRLRVRDDTGQARLGPHNGHAPITPAPRRPATPEPPKKPQRLPDGPHHTIYHYVSADGEAAFAVVRRATPTGKTFSQWTPVNDGLWLSKSLENNRPLYRLPEIAGSTGKVVIVVEGEKCVEAIREWRPGETATTWAGGTNTWEYTDWIPLSNRPVTLLADSDGPGRKAMQGLAAHLYQLGCKVTIGLPDGESGDDIADWLATDQSNWQQDTRQRLGKLLKPYDPPAEKALLAIKKACAELDGFLSQAALAATFARLRDHYAIVAFDRKAGVWREWSQITGWEECPGILLHLARFTRDMLPKGGTPSQHKDWLSLRSLQAIAKLSEQYLTVDWDADPDLIGLPGRSLLDTSTAEVRPWLDSDYISRRLPDGIEKAKDSDDLDRQYRRWDKFLLECLARYSEADRLDIRDYLQMWAGAALTGSCRDEAFVFLWGAPGTGKSTFVETLQAVFGDYATSVSGSRLVGESQNHLQWLAGLENRRLVVIHELPERGKWQADNLNSLISGGRIEANKMRGNSIEFKSTAHLIATGNHRPNASAASGIWRRLRVVQFQNTPAKPDPSLRERLIASRAGVFDWVRKGLGMWLNNGRELNTPAVLIQETATYRATADPVKEFLMERVEESDKGAILVSELYEAFKDWWVENVSENAPSKRSFGRTMDELGYRPSSINNGKRVRGLISWKAQNVT